MPEFRAQPSKARVAREALRDKGQFWTPDWVARAMVRFVLRSGNEVFDPAVGAGAFLSAAKAIGLAEGITIRLRGSELHAPVLAQARSRGLSARELERVEIGDFLRMQPEPAPTGIVANPPYIRHHRLDSATKQFLKALARRVTGFVVDGRAGYHVYFLIQALSLLPQRGRLAFIIPADTCEGVFAPRLWAWIAEQFRIEAVIRFQAGATPFPTVDTNPVVVLISREPPRDELLWARCLSANAPAFERWVSDGMQTHDSAAFTAVRRPLGEALATGLSRDPALLTEGAPVLGDYFHVMRGIATGANAFFFLTQAQARTLGIPAEFLFPAVGRTRDVSGDRLSAMDLDQLDRDGRPTLLFAPDERPLGAFPKRVRDYLTSAASEGLAARALISTRRPWYRMERREPPPFLFAYLGRRNARFIRNDAGARPLTGFLCVYPRATTDPHWRARLWRLLSDPRTVAALPLVGKSYGGGALKVEPRALERLPLASALVAEAGIAPASA